MIEIYMKKINPSIRELLSFATSNSKIDHEYGNYMKVSNRKLFAIELNGEFVGCIGIELTSPIECLIKHIAVSPKQRGQGIGSKMIDFLAEGFPIITAETDKDAVDFYKAYGFVITSLGEKYRGIERFLCEYGYEK